jgi:HEPN domain-containing protein
MKAKTQVGHLRHNVQIIEEYAQLALNDERIATLLMRQGEYRHACYFFIQAMEKLVRATIFTRVDPYNRYFRDETRTHDIEELLDFLLKVVSTEPDKRTSLKEKLDTYVLADTYFERIHNDLRYPKFSEHYQSYSVLEVKVEDAMHIQHRLQELKRFLDEMKSLNW